MPETDPDLTDLDPVDVVEVDGDPDPIDPAAQCAGGPEDGDDQ